MGFVCPSCSFEDTLSDMGLNLCTHCGYVSQEIEFYEPIDAIDLAYSQGQSIASSSLPSSRLLFNNRLYAVTGEPPSREESRKLESYRRRPELLGHIKLTLQRLGKPGLLEQVVYLFDQARLASWRLSDQSSHNSNNDEAEALAGSSRPVRWGQPSISLAAACCFAVLRREAVLVDIAAVSHAAELQVARVRAAVRKLCKLVQLQADDLPLSNPDAHIEQFLAFFLSQLSVNKNVAVRKFLQPLLKEAQSNRKRLDYHPELHLINTPLEVTQQIALGLCAFWWPRRPVRACDPRLAAYIIVIIALEAHLKTIAPRHQLFLLIESALAYDPTQVSEVVSCPQNARSDQALWDRYHEVLSALDQAAHRLPWLHAKLNRTSKSRSDAGLRALYFSHLDLLANTVDILQMAKGQPVETVPKAAAKARKVAQHDAGDVDIDALSTFLSRADRTRHAMTLLHRSLQALPIDGDSQSAPEVEMYPQLRQQIEAAVTTNVDEEVRQHPIDLLSPDQVDLLLFTPDEMQSIFRTNESEREMFLQAKMASGVWDHEDNDVAFYAQRLKHETSTDGKRAKRKHADSDSSTAQKRVAESFVSSITLQDQQEESDWSESD